jgi:hypothetical protein
MITPKSNMTIIEGYLGLLENLNPKTKLDLISKLTATVKSGIITKKSTIKKAFGALDTKQSADELINEIRSSRISTRKIESF